MVQWVIRLIIHGRSIELFLVTASATRLSCLWDDAYKRSLAVKGKDRVAHVMVAGFLSHSLSSLTIYFFMMP